MPSIVDHNNRDDLKWKLSLVDWKQMFVTIVLNGCDILAFTSSSNMRTDVVKNRLCITCASTGASATGCYWKYFITKFDEFPRISKNFHFPRISLLTEAPVD